MLTIQHVALGALPGLLWLAWFWRTDTRQPEPRRHLLRAFLLGGLGALLIVRARPRLEWIFLGEPGPTADVLDAFVVTALAEELVKLSAFLVGSLWQRKCEEPMDGLVYAAAAALGFASVENAFFLAVEGDPALILVRGFTTTLAHASFTAPAGCLLVMARLRCPHGRDLAALGVLGAVLLHGSYDWILMHGEGVGRVGLSLFLAAAVSALGLVMRSPFPRPGVARPLAPS